MRLFGLMIALLRSRKGGTAIEYGLIISLVVITMVAGFLEVANSTTTMWGNVHTKVVGASGG